jgi:XRE family aerobic/anaerobic benzoate catabolism transcriptional regulator
MPTYPPSNQSERLLQLIGERVRQQRNSSGLTRKLLAQSSGVSERYLAQLEQGKCNISIALLSQVAHALQTDVGELTRGASDELPEALLVTELINELGPQDRRAALELLYEKFSLLKSSKRRVALVGLRGAGKTTLGSKLAAHFEVPFVRLADEVERLAGMDISEIFSLSGSGGYRRWEEQALLACLRASDACIIETGGNIVSEPRILNSLLTACFVVWIQASPTEHMRRVRDQGDFRPMADNADAMSDLNRMLAEREPFYAQSHAIINTQARGVEECLAELISLCPPDL